MGGRTLYVICSFFFAFFIWSSFYLISKPLKVLVYAHCWNFIDKVSYYASVKASVEFLLTLFHTFLTSRLDSWKALFYYRFHKILSVFLLTKKAIEIFLSYTKQLQFNLIVFREINTYCQIFIKFYNSFQHTLKHIFMWLADPRFAYSRVKILMFYATKHYRHLLLICVSLP